jgi:hypothetical protein
VKYAYTGRWIENSCEQCHQVEMDHVIKSNDLQSCISMRQNPSKKLTVSQLVKKNPHILRNPEVLVSQGPPDSFLLQCV